MWYISFDFYSNTQANECGQRAMWHRGIEFDAYLFMKKEKMGEIGRNNLP